ncbi:MAG: hypothetical protein IPJ77_22990 [Planctomycetes bacterium]|nr:hypothetical protein [Planctomycetota bacterium]
MEVTSTSNSNPIQPRRNSLEERIDITRVNRDGIQEATEDISEIRAPQEPFALRGQRQATEGQGTRSQQDRIDLSDDAKRLLASKDAANEKVDERRKERLAELEKSYREGTLASRERIERAATAMLTPS